MSKQRPTDKAVALYHAGDVKGFLRIAKGFRNFLTKEEKAQLARGFECVTNPGFYTQLGKDPNVEIEAAIAIFEKHWINKK